MLTCNVGDASASQQPILPVTVPPGGTVVLTNVAGSTLNYYPLGIDGAATTLTPTNNVSLTTSTWMQSQGVTSVTLTGGFY